MITIQDIINALQQNVPIEGGQDLIKNFAENNQTKWVNYYWSSKYIFHFHNSNGEHDRFVIDGLEKALNCGLSFKVNKDLFLDACRELARLLFKYDSLKKASNFLLLLRDFQPENIPPWYFGYKAKISYRLEIDSVFLNTSNFLSLVLKISDRPDILNDQQIALLSDFLERIPSQNSTRLLNESNIKNFIVSFETILGSMLSQIEEKWGNTVSRLLALVHERSEKPDDNTFSILKNNYSRLSTTLESYRNKVIELEEINNSLTHRIDELLSNLQKKDQDYRTQLDEIKQLSIDTQTTTSDYFRILVIGATGVDSNKLIGIAKSLGVMKDQIDFMLDYEKNKRFDIDSLKFSSPYSGIMIGPIAHKVIGLGDYSSMIQKVQKEEGFPPSVEIRTEAGELKLTKSSFKKALEKILDQIKSNIT